MAPPGSIALALPPCCLPEEELKRDQDRKREQMECKPHRRSAVELVEDTKHRQFKRCAGEPDRNAPRKTPPQAKCGHRQRDGQNGRCEPPMLCHCIEAPVCAFMNANQAHPVLDGKNQQEQGNHPQIPHVEPFRGIRQATDRLIATTLVCGYLYHRLACRPC